MTPDFGGPINWQLEILNSSLKFYKSDQLNNVSTFSSPDIMEINEWQHVAVTYNNTTGAATIYLDGQPVASSTLAIGMNNATYPWLMGAAFENGADGFAGDLDDLHVYNYELSATDIFNIYTSEQGLQHWLLEDGNPDDVVTGYTASLNGVITPTPDRFGNSNAAFFLNGASNYVYSSNSIVGGSDQFGVSAWFYPNFQNDFGTIISENDIGGQGVFYIDVSLDNIGLVTHIDGFTTNQVFTSGEKVKPFEWNHVAVTFDNGNAIIYLNGEESASAMLASPVFDGTSNMIVGSGSLFNGNLDDIRIYDYPLSEKQVTDIYYEDGWTGVSTANLRAQYNFTFNTNDDSGNGHDGSNPGGAVFTEDRFGNPNAALSFDGFDDLVDIQHGGLLDISGPEFTVNAWIKPENYPQSPDIWDYIMLYDYNNQMLINGFGEMVYHWPTDGSSSFDSRDTNPLNAPLNQWTMVTWILHASNSLEIYLNGQLFFQEFITRVDVGPPLESSIGGDISSSPGDGDDSRWYHGIIDDVSLYDIVLSTEDIQALYSVNGWTGDPILLAHWPITAADGGNDITGNGNDLDDESSGLGASGMDRFKLTSETFEFDGSNYAVAYSSNHPRGEVTVSYSVWEYHDDVSSGTLLNVGNQGEPNNRSALLMLTPNVLYYVGEGNDYQFATNIPTDRWNHIVLTKEGTELNLYLNGQWVEQGITDPGQNLLNTDIWVGRNNLGNEIFAGRMDDIRIFNYVIDETEVSNLFDEGVDTSIPIVQIEPAFASADDEVRLIYNTERGNKGLMGLSVDDVYFYSGVITSDPDAYQPWDFIANSDFFDNSVGLMTPVTGEANQWEITLGPQLRDYYSIPDDGTPIHKINMVFRNTDGSAFGNGAPEFGAFPGGYVTDGSEFTGGVNSTPGDIYVDLFNLTPFEGDSAALVALYQATNGDFWNNNTNWLTGPLDTWAGVTVSGGRVTGVFLDSNNLDGSLPVTIGLLDACFFFSLTDNNLFGSIPSGIGSMASLEELYLDINSLTGSIPTEIGNLSNLFVLDLSQNELDGIIPSSIGNIAGLEELLIYQNSLIGSLPDELQNLTNLLILDIGDNDLNGLIPDYLSTFSGLQELWLGGNGFSGTISSNLGNLFNLTLLDLARNSFSGSIPFELGNLTGLTDLYLYSNDLFGYIPEELGNLTNLQFLDLSDNGFMGAVPSSFGSMSSLIYLNLSVNEFEDMVDLTGLTFLDALYLDYNKFSMQDLLLNNGAPITYVYAPQELIGDPQNRFIGIGTDYTFDLGFDSAVGGSTYTWYQNGSVFVQNSSPSIFIPSITTAYIGTWHVEITNTSLPGLTLQTEDIFLDIKNICISEASNSSNTRIDEVLFADLDNLSDQSQCATYSNFTQYSATVYPGQTVEFGILMGTCGAEVNKMAKFYIDWNGDGFFNESDELVGQTDVPTSVTQLGFGSATIGADVALGTYLMRVVAQETSNLADISGCGNYPFGETEDYAINVVDGSPDLVMELVDVKPNSIFDSQTPLNAGSDIQITTFIGNTGLIEVTNLTRGVGYYLSADQFLDGSDIDIGSSFITSLPSGQSITLVDETVNVSTATPGGTYYLITQVDPDGIFTDPDPSDNIDVSSLPLYITAPGDTEAPVISLQSAPTSYTKGGSGVTVSASIMDNQGIASVEFYWGGIFDVADDNLDSEYNMLTPEETTTGIYEYSFSDADFDNDLGVQYFFRAFDSSGNIAESSPKPAIISMEYPDGFIGLSDVNPVSNSGDPQVTDYRIFSVPVQSISVGELLGNPTTDKSQWRVWQYNGSNSELTSSSSITAGRGYWLIYQNTAGINVNVGGIAVNTSNSSPFTISLQSGQNLIGNPYSFPISWQEVIDHNIAQSIIADGDVTGLTFYRGSFNNLGNADLGVTEGAFVQSNGNVTLEIPINSSTFFRSGNNARISRNSLDKEKWEVPINLDNDLTAYNVAVVGMNPKAEVGQDKFDLLAMPYLFKYLEFNSKNELFEDRYSGDLVSTADNHIWEFEATTSFDPSDAVLSWDNSYFGDNDQQLFLHDLREDRIINMREQQEYHFYLGDKNNFRILYGSPEFIESSLQPSEITLGRAYPNPFMDITRIPFNLSAEHDLYKVRMTLYNSVGELIKVLAEDEYSSGFYAADWDGTNEFGQEVSEGIYIYKLSITHVNGTDNLTGKLIYGR